MIYLYTCTCKTLESPSENNFIIITIITIIIIIILLFYFFIITIIIIIIIMIIIYLCFLAALVGEGLVSWDGCTGGVFVRGGVLSV